MKTLRRIADVREALAREGIGTVGLVPTMGALHEGHMSLVERCRRECDVVVASIFVNPTQFNDRNDLKNYPRTPEKDLEMLRRAGTDIVFMPSEEEMYPEEDTRVFDFGGLDRVMEGVHRPGHFNGVAQIVSKLFAIVNPDRAYFGEKDFQQLAIVRSLAAQTGGSVEIIGCPTKREADGLAMSSRNMLLGAAQRKAAPLIYETLSEGAKLAGKMGVDEVCRWVKERIDGSPELETEYFTIVDSRTLQPVASWDVEGEKYGCIAVRAGNVRLIDNLKFC